LLIISPDDRLCLVASGLVYVESVSLREIRTGKEVCCFALKELRSLERIAFSADGRSARAVYSFGRKDCLLDFDTGQMTEEVPRSFIEASSTPQVRQVGATMLQEECAGSLVRVKDEKNGKEVFQADVKPHRPITLRLSHDGQRLSAILNNQTALTWDVVAQKELQRIELIKEPGHTNSVNCLAFSPDGCLALSGSNDATVRVWDVRRAKEMLRFRGHGGGVHAVLFSPDGQFALSKAREESLLWDVKTGKELQSFSALAAAWSESGTIILMKDGNWEWREAGTGKTTRKAPGSSNWLPLLAITPDGKLGMTAHSDGSLQLWDLVAAKKVQRFTGHPDDLTCIALSTDGKRMLSVSRDSTARLWDVASNTYIELPSGTSVHQVAFTGDGKRFATAGNFEGQKECTVRLWDAATGGELRRCGGEKLVPRALALSPDSGWALYGGDTHVFSLVKIPR
jgi:WD40 repeat protein